MEEQKHNPVRGGAYRVHGRQAAVSPLTTEDRAAGSGRHPKLAFANSTHTSGDEPVDLDAAASAALVSPSSATDIVTVDGLTSKQVAAQLGVDEPRTKPVLLPSTSPVAAHRGNVDVTPTRDGAVAAQHTPGTPVQPLRADATTATSGQPRRRGGRAGPLSRGRAERRATRARIRSTSPMPFRQDRICSPSALVRIESTAWYRRLRRSALRRGRCIQRRSRRLPIGLWQ